MTPGATCLWPGFWFWATLSLWISGGAHIRTEQSKALSVEGFQSHRDLTSHSPLAQKLLEDVLQQNEDVNRVRQKHWVQITGAAATGRECEGAPNDEQGKRDRKGGSGSEQKEKSSKYIYIYIYIY